MREPELLTYDLGRGACAFSTTRRGGYSEGVYGGFNANAYCGDDGRAVELNRQLLCDVLQLAPMRLVVPHQVHATKAYRVGEDFFRKTDAERAALLEGVDAVLTNLPRTCVCVSTADCIPILIYDAARHAVAAVHAGWRGTLQRIAPLALQAMADAYGTQPRDVEVAIGPGISCEAFEVGDEVYEAFRQAGFPMAQLARSFPVAAGTAGEEKWHLDLWQANIGLLEASGVPVPHIRLAGVCTYSHSDRFFSARRLGVRSGRILNGIFLTD